MDYEAILREHVRNVDQIFADWRELCRQHGWKSGLSK